MPLTASDEMVVPIPIDPQYIKPKVDTTEIRLNSRDTKVNQEARENFICLGLILGVLLAVYLGSRSLYRWHVRQKALKEKEKNGNRI